MRTAAMTWIAELCVVTGLWLATGSILGGCVLPDVDLSNRPCPCAEGWVCVAGVCREGSGGPFDAGPRDAAAIDAAAIDGGAFDAGELDAGELEDAGARDAGEVVDAGRDGGGIDAGRDAGVDAGVDAGRDAGPPPIDGGPGNTRCDDTHAGALFCDGFEWVYPGGRIGWVRDDLQNGNVNTVTSPAPFLGERSMRAQTTSSAEANRAAMVALLDTPISSGDLWLRGMFFLPNTLNVESLSLLYIGDLNGNQGIAIQAYDGGLAALWLGTASSSFRPLSLSIPRNQWACLELHIVVANSGGRVEVFVNGNAGTPNPASTNVDTLPAIGGFIQMRAGIEYQTGAQVPATLFVDEVVISRDRVGCL